MNGFYLALMPILLLISVVSFIIHFRNKRKKMLIERSYYPRGQTGIVIADAGEQKAEVSCRCTCKFCRYCPLGGQP